MAEPLPAAEAFDGFVVASGGPGSWLGAAVVLSTLLATGLNPAPSLAAIQAPAQPATSYTDWPEVSAGAGNHALYGGSPFGEPFV